MTAIQPDLKRPLPKRGAIPHFRWVAALGAGLVMLGVNVALTSIRDVEYIRSHLGLLYFIQTVVFVFLTLWRHRFAVITIVRPSVLTLSYVGASLAVGGWAFSTGNVIRTNEILMYRSWANIEAVFLVISLCLFTFFAASLLELPRAATADSKVPHRRSSVGDVWLLIFLSGAFIASLVITEGLAAQVKTVILATIIFVCFSRRIPFRWVVVPALLVVAAAATYHSKREVIFALAALGFMVFSEKPLGKVRLSHIVFAMMGAALAGVLVVTMSILRGYGHYAAGDFVSAVQYVPTYLQSRQILALLSLNFETTYIFLHLHNAVSNVMINNELVAWGETYARLFFIGPIGAVVNYKPQSIIHLYTYFVAPNFRAIGGSFGITSVGEAIWNFRWGAPIAIALLYVTFDKVFAFALVKLRKGAAFSGILALCGIQFVLYYSRGSGLDLLLIYFLFAVPFAFVMSYVVAFTGRPDQVLGGSRVGPRLYTDHTAI